LSHTVEAKSVPNGIGYFSRSGQKDNRTKKKRKEEKRNKMTKGVNGLKAD